MNGNEMFLNYWGSLGSGLRSCKIAAATYQFFSLTLPAAETKKAAHSHIGEGCGFGFRRFGMISPLEMPLQ